MARFLVAIFAFMCAAVAAVAFHSQRDAARLDASNAELAIGSQCDQLATELDDLVYWLEDTKPAADGGDPATIRDGVGLREDGSLERVRAYAWYREYLACGLLRDWTTAEMSEDATRFRDLRMHAMFSAHGPALATDLKAMSAMIRAVNARPFKRSKPEP